MLKEFHETFFALNCPYDEASTVLFGAPFDSTTSFRPGTRFASRVMRAESFGLETYSPYLDLDLADCPVFDSGDLELCFGNTALALADIEARTETILRDGKLPLMIGGEHLVTLGAVRAAVKQHPSLHVIHFDAHTDLREDYLGETLSHATVMRRVWECTGDGRLHQFGIRSGARAEFLWAQAHTNLHKFNFDGLAEAVAQIGQAPVYFSIDLDVLDPSVFPGTGTPEAGGVTFLELLEAIQLVSKRNIVGCDLNELAPIYDQSGSSTATALKVLRELLLSVTKTSGRM
ncbi:MAG: agmatinase [Oscillospiraceae bacterium]|nr:agmatinase [Oscillospiraceae bacterium]